MKCELNEILKFVKILIEDNLITEEEIEIIRINRQIIINGVEEGETYAEISEKTKWDISKVENFIKELNKERSNK